jgi:hypothetical protein
MNKSMKFAALALVAAVGITLTLPGRSAAKQVGQWMFSQFVFQPDASRYVELAGVNGAFYGRVDQDIASVKLESFGSGVANLVLKAGGGTAAVPAQTVSGYEGQIVLHGRNDAGATVLKKASIQLGAAENWTTTANGTYIDFYTTGLGSTAITKRMRLYSDGGLAPYSRTLAQLQLLAPVSVGEVFFCSNCAGAVGNTGHLVVSTGTSAGNWADTAGGVFK